MVSASGDGVIPTAVITTRGDVDLEPALSGIPAEWPIVVYINTGRIDVYSADRGNGFGRSLHNVFGGLDTPIPDMKVYGYFAALHYVTTEYVYTQADDAVVDAQALLDAWTEDDADRIFLNVADGDTPWISFGAIFRKDLSASALTRYMDAYHDGLLHDDVLDWCEVIFCEQTPWRNVDLGKRDLYQGNANRMEWQPNHYSEQARVRDLARALYVTA